MTSKKKINSINNYFNIEKKQVSSQISLTEKQQKIKKNLIYKFNLTEDEAEKILINIEAKSNKKCHENNHSSKKEVSLNNGGFKNHENFIQNNQNTNKISQINSRDDKVNDRSSISKDENFKPTRVISQISEHDSNNYEIEESNNVDTILSDIIPNYNQNISIELSHVNLTFEVSNEKVDTIKESFIRSLKRNQTKKIKIHALNDVTFKVYQGEKIGIIGYNGAGKSTLLKVITGIYPPDRGFVKTNGKISPLLSLGAGFDYNYSGRKNIFLNGAVLGYDRKFLESKVDEIIEFSELGDFIDIPIKNYSSGMLAKLGFSIATALNPDILIIDEILGVGDINFKKKSADKIKSLMGGGTTVLFVSHSIPQVRELCDKAIWIDGGKVKEIGEINKVCDHYLKDAEKASKNQLENIKLR